MEVKEKITGVYDHPIYYRLLVSKHMPVATIVCMQDFDEIDYNHDRYITNRTFDTEKEAMDHAKVIYNHPNVPLHVKELIQGLFKAQYNVDEYMEGENK